VPYRTTPLATGEYYHIFNRGVAKGNIFTSTYDFRRFVTTMKYYAIDGPKPRFSLFAPTTQILDSAKKIVAFNAYCLMPNHFHFLLKQERDGGISEFISKLINSYTKYFNTKYKRVGPLLQGQFKAVHIDSDEQLLHVNRYIHLNPSVAYLVKMLRDYRWSSYPEYLAKGLGICEKDNILNQFIGNKSYENFVLDQEDYGRTLSSIQHKLIDFED